MIINQGKIIADGSAEELKQSVGSGSALNISLANADFTSVQAALEAITGVLGVEQINSENTEQLTIKLTGKPNSDLREPVYRQIRQTDWLLMEFRQETRSLENTFRELTKEN